MNRVTWKWVTQLIFPGVYKTLPGPYELHAVGTHMPLFFSFFYVPTWFSASCLMSFWWWTWNNVQITGGWNIRRIQMKTPLCLLRPSLFAPSFAAAPRKPNFDGAQIKDELIKWSTFIPNKLWQVPPAPSSSPKPPTPDWQHKHCTTIVPHHNISPADVILVNGILCQNQRDVFKEGEWPEIFTAGWGDVTGCDPPPPSTTPQHTLYLWGWSSMLYIVLFQNPMFFKIIE